MKILLAWILMGVFGIYANYLIVNLVWEYFILK